MGYEDKILAEATGIQDLKLRICDIALIASKSGRVEALNLLLPELAELKKIDLNTMFLYIAEHLDLKASDISALKKEASRKKRNSFDGIMWDMTETGELKHTFANTKNYIVLSGIDKMLAYNEFSLDIEIKGILPWEGKDGVFEYDEIASIKMKEFLSDQYRYDIDKKIINEVVSAIAYENKYHPIRDYLKPLKWDGKKRIETIFIDFFGCDDNCYTRDVSRKVFAGAVARIFEPGCEFHHMLILEGLTGIGKSSFWKILAGIGYGSVRMDMEQDKMTNCLTGSWINEVGELAGMHKKEISWLKKFISDPSDRMKFPYDRRPTTIKRQWILVGTMNPEGDNAYLTDSTGNRRFWPLACNSKTKIDFDYLKEIRDQLWAEAVVIYNNKESLYLDNPESIAIHDRLSTKRLSKDSNLEGRINYFITLQKDASFSMTDIFNFFEIRIDSSSSKSLQTKIGIILRKKGYIKRECASGDFYKKEKEGGDR